jgi:hypothetical protein
MATLKEVRRLAREIGATVEDTRDGGTHECRVEAPDGFYWAEGSVHEMVDCSYRPWKPDYADLLSRMKYGVTKCTDPDCDWCHPAG